MIKTYQKFPLLETFDTFLTPGVTYRMFQALANNKINILAISTSEIKISVLINKKHVKKAISALHKEFDLDR